MATKTIKKTAPTAKSKSTKIVKTSPAKKEGFIKTKFSNLNIKTLILPVSIILILFILGIFRNQFIAATVNDEQISRLELLMELEKSDGQRVLQTLITEKLIAQEAKNKNITVSEEEIDAEVEKIEESVKAQGQELDALLAIQNFTRQQLKEQLENQVLLQKMVNAEEINITDEEVDKYITDNQESFTEGTNPNEIREEIREQLKQQKINGAVQVLLSEIQSKASIEILLN